MAMSQQDAQSELGREFPTTLEPEQIMANRYYIQKIAETVQYLAVHGLAFCGMAEDKSKRLCKAEADDPSPDELFRTFFLWTIRIDEKLQVVLPNIPASASYKSPDFTNEVISVLGSMVLEEIASLYKTSDVNLFSVKVVETPDINGPENLSVVVRFVKDGRLAEHLLGLHTLSRSTADYISDRLLQVLTDCGFNPEQLIAQCYDGICILAGMSRSVQKAIQEKLGKAIPYVHACDHQLDLAIVQACSKIVPVKDFFNMYKYLYDYDRKSALNKLHAGTQLKTVIDTTRSLLILLEEFRDSEGRGILAGEPHEDVMFIFSALLMHHVLAVLQPGNVALQDKDPPLGKAVETVNACISLLKERRSNPDVPFEQLWEKTCELCEEYEIPVEGPRWAGGERKEEQKDFASEGSAETSGDVPFPMQFKKVFIDVHDYCISEAEAWFSNYDRDYLSALDSLVPSSSSFLEVKAVKPLLQLVGADEDKFALEAEAVKSNILTPRDPLLQGKHSIHNALAVLFSHKKTFPNVYRVLAAAVTSGAFTDTQESVFPCLAHILQSERFIKSDLRLNSLVLLSYENSLTGNITMEAFLDKFRAQLQQLQL